jgi:hypothetical protein
MAAKKKGTVAKVGAAVTDTAAAVVQATDEHVVQPVGQALGLTGGAKAKAPARKKAAKKPAKTAAAKKPAAKKAAKKPAAKGK